MINHQLTKHGREEHLGSLDADLALNFRGSPEEAYEIILETIQRLGYSPRSNTAGKAIPASFEKTVQVEGARHRMQVDFLAGEMAGASNHTDINMDRICSPTKLGARTWCSSNFKQRM
jgi:hypothetical protein